MLLAFGGRLPIPEIGWNPKICQLSGGDEFFSRLRQFLDQKTNYVKGYAKKL